MVTIRQLLVVLAHRVCQSSALTARAGAANSIHSVEVDDHALSAIGEGPCTDVVALLERVGFVVSAIEMDTSKLDGLCSWSASESRPHILLATDKMSFPRRQMDAAHEMAHAVLHRSMPTTLLSPCAKFQASSRDSSSVANSRDTISCFNSSSI